jgi:hypothetical protein
MLTRFGDTIALSLDVAHDVHGAPSFACSVVLGHVISYTTRRDRLQTEPRSSSLNIKTT